MDQDFIRIEKLVKGIICDFPEIKLIYLFGSRTQKNVGSRSDYDFAVLTDPKQSMENLRARIAHAFSIKLNYDGIDVVLLNNSPIDLAYAVVSNGKRFYEKSVEIRVDYEAYVLGRYCDYLPVLRAQRDEVIRGENHASRIQRYRRLDELNERLARLEPLKDKSRESFDRDPYLRDIVERNLEITAQCCIDICNRIISLENAKKPIDYYDAIFTDG